MSRVVSAVFVALSCGALACGGPDDGKKSDAGTDQGTPAEYWGLADKTCLHYADTNGNLYYSVEIIFDQTSITGVDTWRLVHRNQGFEQRTDWLEIVDDALVLHRRNVGGGFSGSDVLYRYDPPPVLLSEGFEAGDSVESVTNTRIGGDTETVEQTFRVASLGEETVEGPEGPVASQKLTVSIETSTGTEVERAWFAPQVGFVKLDPAGNDVDEVTLARVDVLADEDVCSAE